MMPTATQTAPTLPQTSQSTAQHIAMQTGIVITATAFLALSAHIALPLPFSPVPLTLQTFAVLIIGLTFTPAMAGTTLALYLAEGLCGLPVFAPGIGGIAQLMGPTGGYLLAYPLAAIAAGFVAAYCKRLMPRMAANMIGGLCATCIVLAQGASWLGAWTHATPAQTAMMGITPFLPGEAIKIVVAAGIATTWTRLRKRSA